MCLRGLLNAFTDQIKSIFRDREARRFATHGFDLRCDDERIVFEDVTGFERAADRDEFRSGWENCYLRFAIHLNLLVAGSGNRTEIDWLENMTSGQNQLCSDNVLSHRPHM